MNRFLANKNERGDYLVGGEQNTVKYCNWEASMWTRDSCPLVCMLKEALFALTPIMSIT